jgi:septum formation protein
MNSVLYLASGSASRKYLLEEAKIPFTVLRQTADEAACDWSLPIEQLVVAIAQSKMAHAVLPAGAEGMTMYVLTADTLTQDAGGVIYGKPVDYASAVASIKALRGAARVVTGFCLEKKQFVAGTWHTIQAVTKSIVTRCEIDIPDAWIATYFKEYPLALSCAGAMAIERYGMLFLKSVEGSYSNIIGLPLVEVRQALEFMGFYQ